MVRNAGYDQAGDAGHSAIIGRSREKSKLSR
jgi:hypothetical protein